MKPKTYSLLFILVSFFLAGCVTTVPVKITRPAREDLNGAKSIAILPFRQSSEHEEKDPIISILNFLSTMRSSNSDEERISNYLTSKITEQLISSKYFTVIDSSTAVTSIKNNTQPQADAYITGKINSFGMSVQESVLDEKVEGKPVKVTYYTRHVNLEISYEVIDSHTKQILDYKIKSYTNSSPMVKDKYALQPPFETVRTSLDELITDIVKDVQPYTEIIPLSLLPDKNPDMKEAEALAKNGLITQAKNKYLTIYKNFNTFEAGYNAAKLMIADNDLENAKILMTELVEKTHDKRAVSSLNNIQYEINSAQRLKDQTEKHQEPQN